jgi:transposase
VDTISARVRGDLTDAQWAVLRPLLPVGRKPGRPPKWTKRQLIDASRWRTRIGAPWREIPERYGPWQNAYSLFRTWSRDGTWAATLTGLQARVDANGLICWDVSIDSTIARRTNSPPERECGISRLKQYRAVATWYDKLACRYQATVTPPSATGYDYSSDTT